MKIVSFLLIGWGILMAALGIAALFFRILTPGTGIDIGLIFRLGIGIVAIYFGQLLYRKSKQSEFESDDQSVEDA